MLKVYLEVFEINEKAKKIYEKVGFKTEGIKEKHIYNNGQYKNLVCMRILI